MTPGPSQRRRPLALRAIDALLGRGQGAGESDSSPIWRSSHQPVNLVTFLRSRLAWHAGLGFAVVMLLLVVNNHVQHLRNQHSQAELALLSAVDSVARTAESKYAERRRSVLFLANTPPVKGLVRALQSAGVDAQESSTSALWQRRLEQIFTAYLTATPEAYQVRFIGVADDGMELVRAERNDNRVVVVPPERLQRKGDAVYVREALRLPQGQVFVSDISLNREHGRVDWPHRPTIRYATPVHDDQGRVFGAIVINVDLSGRLGILPPGSGPRPQVYATTAQGDFLAHPDPTLTFGFDLDKRHRWAEPEQRIACLHRWPVQHEIAIALRHEFQNLRLGAALRELLADLLAQVFGQIGLRGGDGFVLAHQAAQLFGDLEHTRFQRRVGRQRRGLRIRRNLRGHAARPQGPAQHHGQQHNTHGLRYRVGSSAAAASGAPPRA